jgi:hypothetical protein
MSEAEQKQVEWLQEELMTLVRLVCEIEKWGGNHENVVAAAQCAAADAMAKHIVEHLVH